MDRGRDTFGISFRLNTRQMKVLKGEYKYFGIQIGLPFSLIYIGPLYWCNPYVFVLIRITFFKKLRHSSFIKMIKFHKTSGKILNSSRSYQDERGNNFVCRISNNFENSILKHQCMSWVVKCFLNIKTFSIAFDRGKEFCGIS